MYWSLLTAECKNLFHEDEKYRHEGCKSVYVCLLNTVMYWDKLSNLIIMNSGYFSCPPTEQKQLNLCQFCKDLVFQFTCLIVVGEWFQTCQTGANKSGLYSWNHAEITSGRNDSMESQSQQILQVLLSLLVVLRMWPLKLKRDSSLF